jgi:hypothetical protein
MKNGYIKACCAWFIGEKAPHLKDKVLDILEALEKNDPLTDGQKKGLGFILFDYCMHKGPESFIVAEKEAREIGVLEYMTQYARDWIEFSKKK